VFGRSRLRQAARGSRTQGQTSCTRTSCESPACKEKRELTYGQAYDSHCNLVLGDVEETVYLVEEDEEGEEAVRVRQERGAELKLKLKDLRRR
jgi:hypothetical protein